MRGGEPQKSRHNPVFEGQQDRVQTEHVDVEMGMSRSSAAPEGEPGTSQDSPPQEDEEQHHQEYLDASKLLNEVPPHRRVAVSLTNVSVCAVCVRACVRVLCAPCL